MSAITVRRIAASGVALLTSCATAAMLHAQSNVRVSGSIETGAAAVEQPLVRSGTAYYVAPSLQLGLRDLTFGGDAVFATGTPLWRSVLASGFVRSPAMRNIRIVGTGDVLKTSGLVHTLHGDLGAEWRGSSAANTFVARARAGQFNYSRRWFRDVNAGASVLHSSGSLSWVLDANFVNARRPTALQRQIGSEVLTARPQDSSSFTGRTFDLTPRMIWERGRLRTDASVALRAIEGGLRGTRVGPQLSFTLQTARGLSLFVGGVQRLPDVRAGVPSGRTALLGLRIEGRRVLSPTARAAGGTPSLRVERSVLLVDAGPQRPVRLVELRGDFTNWQPRSCQARGARLFDCGTAPSAGTWRVSIRIDEGAWQHPANLAPAADDFGTVDGVLLTGGKP